MYVVKHKSGHKKLNIIVETKYVENKVNVKKIASASTCN